MLIDMDEMICLMMMMWQLMCVDKHNPLITIHPAVLSSKAPPIPRPTHTHTHTHIHTHTHTHTLFTQTNTHTYTVYINTHTHTRFTQTNTRTYTVSHSPTHTQTYSLSLT